MPAFAGDPLIQRIDHMVPHTSTAPGNAGEEVELFVRERSLSPAVAGEEPREAIILVPGATSPSVVAFDLDFEDYSWAEALVGAGYDVFLMDPTGYGFSPRPGMDDPCNVNPEHQEMLVPNPIEATCEPNQAQPVTSESEWDEIDTVVDFVREQESVDQVHLLGWSGGTMRIGGYTARNPEKVDRLILFGPSSSYESDGPNEPPEPYEFATQLNTADSAFRGSWNRQIQCGDQQLDPLVRPEIWAALMAFDPLGATWGNPAYDAITTSEGGFSRSVRFGEQYGFNAEHAGQLETPALVILGKLDESHTANAEAMYADLGSDDKTMVIIDCASHYAQWERTAPVIHQVSIDWLKNGEVAGIDGGIVALDALGQPIE